MTPQATEDSKENLNVLNAPPDGGMRAWLIVAAIFGINMAQGGYLVAWGTFQAFYQTSILRDKGPSTIAWIGSIQYALDGIPGLLAGRLLDAGYFRIIFIASCVASTLANFTIPECHQYYQFFLAQSILYGLGAGFLYTPCLGLISHWFSKKRPLVFAIVTVGSGVGGAIYPVMFRRLEPRIGFQWTMRVFAFYQTLCFLFGYVVLRPRINKAETALRLFDFNGVVRSPPYIFYVFATFLAFMALFTPLTFMTIKAEHIGISSDLSFYLVAIVNASTIPGRLICGLLARKYGALNLTFIATCCSVAFILAWAFVTDPLTYIIMSVCYGILSGAFLGIFLVPVVQMGDVHDSGRRTGLQLTILSIGALIGPPISGAIQMNNGFGLVGVYAGEYSIFIFTFLPSEPGIKLQQQRWLLPVFL
ncbi:MFS general substrate transporter [Dendrothele bispora CBS 962.96]|uniref:MFS general substrate transporter n=1 Tax=Dendrothele bispora (strain CBS 962.96) TaxID=1314807 RepID=A0A4S8LS48_DENBC|nr:MFS general substrate transporter [Dendrothele bispora CBS 962.96]